MITQRFKSKRLASNIAEKFAKSIQKRATPEELKAYESLFKIIRA
jgi:hypothetical protein